MADEVARSISRRSYSVDPDDVRSMAHEAVCKLDAQGKRITPLSIRGRTIDLLRKERPIREADASLEAMPEGTIIEALTHDEHDEIEAFVHAIEAERAITQPRRRLIVFLRYHADWTVQEIADYLGVSHVAILKTLRKAHEQMEARL